MAIRANVKVDDRSEVFMTALLEAQVAGLIAAGRSYQRDMKRALRGGNKGYVYKTTIGNVGHIVKGKRRPWYTGVTWNSVTVSPVETTPAGSALQVGTNVAAALYWELGHHNIFTKHFERDEKWVPTYRDNQQRYAADFSRAFTARMRELGTSPKDAAGDAGENVDVSAGDE